MPVKLSAGAKADTADFVIDDFSGGSNYALAESRLTDLSFTMSLLLQEMELGPGGDVRRRPGAVEIPLVNAATGLPIDECVIRIIRFQRVNSNPMYVLATSNHLYRFHRWRADNCEEILNADGGSAFEESARLVDYDIFYNKLYIATGTNRLIEWDGINPASYISAGYDADYRRPSLVRKHMGHLVLSGFTDIRDSRAASQLRWTPIASAATLQPELLEVRTNDDDTPTAMASIKAGLIVWKNHSAHILVGEDMANSSDMALPALSVLHGCVGPAAWAAGERGIYAVDSYGVFLYSKAGEPAEVSVPISPTFRARNTITDLKYPRAQAREMAYCVAIAVPKSGQVIFLMPLVH